MELPGGGDIEDEDVADVRARVAVVDVLRLPQADAVVRSGGWSQDFTDIPCRAGDLTLGVLGLGRIARTLTRIAAPVFGRIIAHDPHATDWPDGADRTDLDTLVADSGILSLHVPSTPQTRGIVNAELLTRLVYSRRGSAPGRRGLRQVPGHHDALDLVGPFVDLGALQVIRL
ncbi:NAD(P)-dependent oxidoreductase [Streptomyces sp. NPDC056160]|uniref:NAD(P)-dependent oxidoreductase n=1 Tax=Streptomyces sp. NPDC056160 TaxID=3345731 RepID=UPI0035DB413C